MQLDADSLYRAVQSRDRRFEGRFVLGVVTTGVYCRPGCPARIPKKGNVRFYACSAAAEDAGFRACRRCRPEASIGAAVLLGTAATVTRALRLIDEGALDDGRGVPELAARLGVGERHLRRLFADHLGTSPLSIARTRRVHFAKKLLDETAMKVTDVASAAGFSSQRRFNAEMLTAFHRAPRDLRRAHPGRTPAPVSTLRLAVKAPFDWPLLADFLRLRATPGVEVVGDHFYARTASIDGASGVVRVTWIPDRSQLALEADAALSRGLLRIATRITRLFDLSADPAIIGEHLARDPHLAEAVAAHPGLRVPGAWDAFEVTVRAVLGQQVSVKGATTLTGRLAKMFGEPLAAPSEGLTHLFPTPAAMANAPIESIGLPRARGETLRLLAAAVRDGTLDLDAPRGAEGACADLAKIPGIGPWTASYVAMRAFGEPDAFPASDLGIRRALATDGVMPSARDVERRSEAWRPWRAYAALHLWSRPH